MKTYICGFFLGVAKVSYIKVGFISLVDFHLNLTVTLKTLAVFLPSSATALEALVGSSIQRFELNQPLLRCINSSLKEYPLNHLRIYGYL